MTSTTGIIGLSLGTWSYWLLEVLRSTKIRVPSGSGIPYFHLTVIRLECNKHCLVKYATSTCSYAFLNFGNSLATSLQGGYTDA